ncbi:unnamed protein product, partial [Brugia timori]|uniref:Histidine acid phosphatase n=1 Tax=Brugia timori TaxID=42155 RepID=A0A0R3QSN5_9BILA
MLETCMWICQPYWINLTGETKLNQKVSLTLLIMTRTMSLMLTSLNLFTGPQHRGAYFTHNIIDYALLGHVNLYFMLTLPHLFLLLFNCASNNAFILRTTDEKTEHLIYVQAIWRHGDRAPHQLPYPRDLNDESSWPRGWSQLTNMGIKQLYELGLFFRKRYNGYIKEFNPADIRILTSRSDRAIVSAQAMLRGFFPVDNIAMQWLKDELWQPISFHSESIERNAP